MKVFLQYLSILLLLTFYYASAESQNNAGKFGLEITNPNFSVYVGPYRGRTAQTDGFFNQGIVGFGQIYFPFQLVIDYRSNFLDSAIVTNEYNKRIFLIRPSALFQVVDNGSYALGIAVQLSWLIVKEFYLEYQISLAYVEATKAAAPDLYSGFNLHHFVSLSKPISKHFTLSAGYSHLSNAYLVDAKGSNMDAIVVGLKWNL
ncbi:MAG: hypothetical protein CO118_09010 [Flavobacteriales bacterium CG_4_9_14_3_um_filter_32_8]|nr:MAG: hypothetical protein CO118_09010 [Flavobacteriales bacterium CG_4_9_14_3_um_filter_32_8]